MPVFARCQAGQPDQERAAGVPGRGRAEDAVRLRLGYGLAAGLVLLLTSPPALADLKLCNFTSSRVGVAIGYRAKDDWVTEGWWNVLSNSCETIVAGELKARFYYVHAVDYDRLGEWSGEHLMCIGDKAFTLDGIEDCESRGAKSAGFYEVDTGEAKDYTIRLVDPGESEATP